jgi:aerobic-type carbon monoxide dehydrogenase small subunit (CoxS/CutS family)
MKFISIILLNNPIHIRRTNAVEKTVSFHLNGKDVSFTVDDERSLLWVLRTDLGLTGTKFGCGEGWCRVCNVLVDGKVRASCQTPVGDVAGRRVVTIEGLAKNNRLHPLQEAFIEHDALQCGFCTPGMIIRAAGLLADNPEPTRREIIEGMDENLCRCGAHVRIIEAIETAAGRMKGRAVL